VLNNPTSRLQKPKKQDKAPVKVYNSYLLPIQYDDLPNSKYFTSQEAALKTEEYYNLYAKWKKEKKEEIRKNLRLIDQTKTLLACAQCGVRFSRFFL